MSGEVAACDCEPHTWDDGSVSHEDWCAIYPWCPHEAGAYTCGIPCGCVCRPCDALAVAHAAFKAARAAASPVTAEANNERTARDDE